MEEAFALEFNVGERRTIGKQIYWANTLFTDAERAFNEDCAKRLREVGHEVFLPQEALSNGEAKFSTRETFRVNTSAILNAPLVAVCLDQENIDSNVACAVGLAFAFGVPMIGFYSDRQSGGVRCRTHETDFLVGALQSSGQIVTSFDDLLTVLSENASEFPE